MDTSYVVIYHFCRLSTNQSDIDVFEALA